MADDISTNLLLTLMEEGSHDSDWGAYANENFDVIDEKIGDVTTLSVTSGTVTLSDTQERVNAIIITGAMSGNVDVVFSGRGGTWIIRNETSGSYTVTCKVSGQGGVGVPQGNTTIVFFDGTDIAYAAGMTNVNIGVLAPAEKLVIATADPNILLNADAILLRKGSLYRRFNGLSSIINMVTTGANGRDTGVESPSKWYHIWAIGKDDGTVDGLASLSEDSPTLPAGYDWKGYCGAVWNQDNSVLRGLIQSGTQVTSGPANGQYSFTNLTAQTGTGINIEEWVPTTARTVEVAGQIGPNPSSAITIAAHASGSSFPYGYAMLAQGRNVFFGPGRIVMSTLQRIGYFVGGASAVAKLSIVGWGY